jgi:hypothetical protein
MSVYGHQVKKRFPIASLHAGYIFIDFLLGGIVLCQCFSPFLICFLKFGRE